MGSITAANGGNTPSFTSGCANFAFGVAMTMSPNATSSEPAPMAGPLTTTISGLEISRMALNTRLKASSVWNTRSDFESSSDMPAENIFWLLVIRMALMSLRELSPSIASAISAIIGTVSTLYGGWFNTSFATKLDVSNWMNLKPSFIGAGEPSVAVAMGQPLLETK